MNGVLGGTPGVNPYAPEDCGLEVGRLYSRFDRTGNKAELRRPPGVGVVGGSMMIQSVK